MMKTLVLNVIKTSKSAILCLFVTLLTITAAAQSLSGAGGLKFNNPTLLTPVTTDLKKGAVYLFQNVMTGVNAKVKIDTLVGGAEVRKIDDNSGGLGYTDAFQPEIKSPSGTGECYAQFSITFFKLDNVTLQPIDSLRASSVDIDGNLRVKEFAEINMNGGSAAYMSTSLDISVLQVLLNRFRGENLLGIERTNIDTAAWGNMYTVRKSNVTSFTVKYGTTRLFSNSVENRQYSLYMKGFNYPDQVILPVKFESFFASLNNSNNKVDLKWATSMEKNVSHFVIEKSLDGRTYSDAGTVFAYGNTTEKMNYSFSDNVNTTQVSVIYYRLRSVDADGKTDFSITRAIRTGKQSTSIVSISTYPNPATSDLRVTIPSNWQGKKVSYEIVTANSVAVKKLDVGSSTQTETFNISSLAPGLYLVKVSCGAESAVQKIIKN